MQTILVTGATGHLGRHVVQQLISQGKAVRALTRDPKKLIAQGDIEPFQGNLCEPETLHGVCEGVDAVIACAGASLDLNNLGDRASYMDVDFKGTLHVLEQAQLERVQKFVYVSLASADRLIHTAYVKAHEYVVHALETAELPYTVVRPTGFFYVFLEMLKMAQRGRGFVIGSGEARTNPIHEADVAALCIEALEATTHTIEAGGPETLTRRGITELAFEVLGKTPKITSIPGWLMHLIGGGAKLVNPRLGALMAFGTAVSLRDVIAPKRGQHTLRAYFEAHRDAM